MFIDRLLLIVAAAAFVGMIFSAIPAFSGDLRTTVVHCTTEP